MKKLYMLFLMVGLNAVAFGQNVYTIITPVNPTSDLVTPTNTDVTGDTAEYFNSDEYTTIVAPLLVINDAVSQHNVKVRRTILNAVSGSSNFFCWDLCYTAATSVSGGTVAIASNDTAFLFYADYNPAGNSGTTYINYKFFNNGDSTEFASATIKFTSGTVGIENEVAAITNVYPNPASAFINFDYVLGHAQGSVVITDLTGKVVRTAILPSHSTKHTFGLDGLHDGIYIYTFYEGNKAISTKKFIVNK